MIIENINARQILDSRGTPTIETDVHLQGGHFGRAAVPSGASTGQHEAVELRDNEPAYQGQGLLKAVALVNAEISGTIKGIRADDQNLIDKKLIELDGTENKSRLGANSILSVSLAVAHAAANARQLPLYRHINDIAHGPQMSIPMPMMNVLNGGKHANNSADFQEYMIIPIGATSYTQAVQMGAEVFYALKANLSRSGSSTTVGDEGGFTYSVSSNTEMLDMLNQATFDAGYKSGSEVGYALDVAASELFDGRNYLLNCENRQLDGPAMIDYLNQVIEQYPVISIEDGLDQDQWEDWTKLTSRLGNMQIVGDDLLVTNITRLKTAQTKNAANAILIKLNQIGTLSETLEVIKYAQDMGWRTIVSHRSGETEDITISHLAVGTGAGQIKTGSLSRTERTAKHNELMRIEEQAPELNLANPFL